MGVRGKMVDQLIMRTKQSLAHLAEERTSSLLMMPDMLHQIFVPIAVETTRLALERALLDHGRDILEHKVLSGRVSEGAVVVKVRNQVLPHLPG